MKNISLKKLVLDFIWAIFPEWLGTIIKDISGGWILAKCYDPETNEVIAYRLVCHNDESKTVTLWGDI